MYIEEITYEDFNGNERTEEFCFNLTQQEVEELNINTDGGLQEYAKRIAQEQDAAKIIKLFKEIIDLSYGVKSLDGKHFYKDEEVLRNFKSTQAYSDFYMSLLDADKATKFFNAIVPKEKKKVEPQDHQKKVTPINK